jgi:hypothetical protein
MADAADRLIQKNWDEFAGAASPSPAPKTTVSRSGAKSAKKAAAKK